MHFLVSLATLFCVYYFPFLLLVLGLPSSFFSHLFFLMLSVYPVSVCAYGISVLQCSYLPVPVVVPVTFI